MGVGEAEGSDTGMGAGVGAGTSMARNGTGVEGSRGAVTRAGSPWGSVAQAASDDPSRGTTTRVRAWVWRTVRS